MATRLPDQSDVDMLRDLVESTPPGPLRDEMEERLRLTVEAVRGITPASELPYDPSED